ncbi:putative eukaryotic translation initiation factor [Leishmania infantum JPCM5]|uniref:Eukaryotic translation initiation factor 3 subunit E n=3 Tax=Leishmania donovani species complex TaxID=38574 RepID=A0A6L0XIA9_LEIIN|nr:putative eukaryotic translation initiation factor [Leishmania infantum JPCM5]XP_003862346.1 eukaryotic translation initiation factor, putative [Leishmania donovani]CAC9504836.1 eukaryotic_translation_initiation_factor_-_putative [Leishmania infantum]TPP54373.1 eIF3 subunit 6 N terminal domain family protein [Leishmania donovani]CAM69469.1 putative eukaryotic translation initiation factor [Leishmania infantum JPCM5]CBZ35652.1 eukaryotic translation initiation factor, putative [Leishmania don|eukprot:XP_001470274.1 putative eukaryotic translation initiation factor [Leishmania infantum JPCM5]
MDMLTKLLPYMDKHLALGLLNHYAQNGEDVQDAMMKLIETTGLNADGSIKTETEEMMAKATAAAQPALKEFFDESEDDHSTYQFKLTETEIGERRTQGELSHEFLSEKKGITAAVMNALYKLAYLYYDTGAYGDASELLTLCQCVSGYDNIRSDTILWGKLMSDIGAVNWQSAMRIAEEIRRLHNASEEDLFGAPNTTTVRARVWLLHWVLFPFFKGGLQYSLQLLYFIFDHRHDQTYRKAVETVCPHYLRYICAAVLLHRTRYSNFVSAAELVEAIYEYSDPLTQLVSLIQKASFEDAIALLPEVRRMIKEDYFLADYEDELIENAKRMIFSKYMSLHSVVSIPYVAEQLDMSKADAEVWLVNLISESVKHRAKIDSVNEQLNVEPQTRSLESLIYDKLDTVLR